MSAQNTKSYLGQSDYFEFAIKNNECIEIGGNYGQEIFQGISFDIFLMKSRICNPVSDTLTLLATITKNIEVYNNVHDESRRLGFYKHEKGANHGSKKRVYNKIFVIVSCEYEIRELVCSFMFIFDQVHFGTDSARGILGIIVCPLVSGHVIEREESEVVVGFPVLKREFVKDVTSWDFDSRYDGLVYIIAFKANNPSIKTSENIHRE